MNPPPPLTCQENNERRQRRLRAAKKKGTHTQAEWEALKREFGFACVRCGATDRKITKDHVKPLFLGGSDGLENIQPLCKRCNSSKKSETVNWAALARARRHGEVISGLR